MSIDKELLIMSGARLYSIGVEVEAARAKLKELVDSGVPYTDERVLKALEEYKELKEKWDNLEQQHLEMRDEILKNEAPEA
ncbi:MAG: hypothetical protein IJP43_09680 [Oscillospiraceae bacterium]|nr:hypothetical protein [Oscillospiraceae bacterium]